MAFPNFKGKHTNDSLINPDEYMRYRKNVKKDYPSFKAPKGMILCYSRKVLEYILNNENVTPVKGFFGEMYLLKDAKNSVGVIGKFGIGAPIASVLLEELIAFGVKRFISLGTAGTLQKDVSIGDVIVCNRAIRDEGTSHHYVKAGKYAYPSKHMTDKIKSCLERLDVPYIVGTTWTIDAPYRETVAEARRYQKEGVLTVEMEASALFTIAKYRGVHLGSLFTISDSLAELEWKPHFHSKQTEEGLQKLYMAAVEALK